MRNSIFAFNRDVIALFYNIINDFSAARQRTQSAGERRVNVLERIPVLIGHLRRRDTVI